MKSHSPTVERKAARKGGGDDGLLDVLLAVSLAGGLLMDEASDLAALSLVDLDGSLGSATIIFRMLCWCETYSKIHPKAQSRIFTVSAFAARLFPVSRHKRTIQP